MYRLVGPLGFRHGFDSPTGSARFRLTGGRTDHRIDAHFRAHYPARMQTLLEALAITLGARTAFWVFVT